MAIQNISYLGKRLKTFRKLVIKKSQKEICEELICAQSALSQVENGSTFGQLMIYVMRHYVEKYNANINWVLASDNHDISMVVQERIEKEINTRSRNNYYSIEDDELLRE